MTKTSKPKASEPDEYKGPLAGHTLVREGRISGYVAGNVGPGRCSCGAISPDLESNAARQRWHREHKAAVAAEK